MKEINKKNKLKMNMKSSSLIKISQNLLKINDF